MFYTNGCGKGFERSCYSRGGIAGVMELTGLVSVIGTYCYMGYFEMTGGGGGDDIAIWFDCINVNII